MNTRFLTLAMAMSAAMLLTACGTGGTSDPNDFENPFPTTPPTVTFTGPTTASAGVPFELQWTTTDADFCNISGFIDQFDAEDSVEVNESSVGTKTYTIRCKGPSVVWAQASVTVEVGPGPSAEGLWSGSATVGGNPRNLYGVITREGNYWLAYSVGGAVSGFYAGNGTSLLNQGSSTTGSFASPSLREINFAGGFAGGNAAEGNITSSTFTDGVSVANGVLGSDAVITGATFNIADSGTLFVNPPFALAGILNGTTISEASGSNIYAQNHPNTAALVISGTSGTLTILSNIKTTTNLGGTQHFANTVTLTGAWNGTTFTPQVGSFTINSCSSEPGANPCVPNTFTYGSVGGSLTFSGSILTSSTITTEGMINSVNGVIQRETFSFLNPSLQTLPSVLPFISTGTFNLTTYDVAYEGTPLMSDLAGTYTGTAGVGVGPQVATFVIDGTTGAITGSDPLCSYTGKAAPHSTGNLYDVTELAFTGGSCPNTGETFTGVVVYDANTKTATLMALNGDRDLGFMLVGAKP